MRVFVSSVINGYEEYRAAAADAIRALEHEAVLMQPGEQPASPSGPQSACLTELEECDAVVFLMGARYGWVNPHSDKSAVREEWEHADAVGKPCLVFAEVDVEHEADQRELLDEMENYIDGRFRAVYRDTEQLILEVVKALRALADRETPAQPARLAGLPPNCQEAIAEVEQVDPQAALRLLEVLCNHGLSLGRLARIVAEPPEWIVVAPSSVWDALVGFMDAYEIEGAEDARRRAVREASPRSSLHLIALAIKEADGGNMEQAEALLAQLPEGHACAETARARAANDHEGAISAVHNVRLHQSADRDIALFGATMLAWGLYCMEQPSRAADVLRQANEAHPGRGFLLMAEAEMAMAAGAQALPGTTESREWFRRADETALRSRDSLRQWAGPSHQAVALACSARRFLGDYRAAADIAAEASPGGEEAETTIGGWSTQEEAAHPDVISQRGLALVMLPDRRGELFALPLDDIDTSDALAVRAVRAVRAHMDEDPAAGVLARRALDNARDLSERRTALMCVASIGALNEDELAATDLAATDVSLALAMSEFASGDYAEAAQLLEPLLLESPVHADYLAEALHRAGDTGAAVECLEDAARQFSAPALLVRAVEMLVRESEDPGRAEEIAQRVLAQDQGLTSDERQRLMGCLVDLAGDRQNWPAMEAWAQAAVHEDPDHERARWVVASALHLQAHHQQAWDYIKRYGLHPFDEATAVLFAEACRLAPEVSDDEISRVAEIAEEFGSSEEAGAAALIAAQVRLADPGRSALPTLRLRVEGLLDLYSARYPHSEHLRRHEGDSEELLSAITADLEAQLPYKVLQLAAVEAIRIGHMPYGVLGTMTSRTYAEVLLTVVVGTITAIPTDPELRDQERAAAENALGGTVAADTSAPVVCLLLGLDPQQLASEFKKVFAANEQRDDARQAVASARQQVVGFIGIEPATGRLFTSETTEEQQAEHRTRAAQLSACLEGWQRIESHHLPRPSPPPEGTDGPMSPWDAAMRVAIDQDCSLWADDCALRDLARAEGVQAFGTWALLEALAVRAVEQGESVPDLVDIKHQMLSAGIADIPLSSAELDLAITTAGDQIGSDVESVVAAWLSRPAVWVVDFPETLHRYTNYVWTLTRQGRSSHVPELLYAAALGAGPPTDVAMRPVVIGGLLSTAVSAGGADPESVPVLIDVVRRVSHRIVAAGVFLTAASEGTAPNPEEMSHPDVAPILAEAVRGLFHALEPAIDSQQAVQAVMRMFASAEPDDRETIAAALLNPDLNRPQ